jgi:hypothetical protein
MSMPDADPCLYKFSPTRTYPLLCLRMHVASAPFGSMLGISLCSLMKLRNVTRQLTSIIETSQFGSVGPWAMVLGSGVLMDWWCNSWMKTPGGTLARLEPSFESTSAPTLLLRITLWISRPERTFDYDMWRKFNLDVHMYIYIRLQVTLFWINMHARNASSHDFLIGRIWYLMSINIC